MISREMRCLAICGAFHYIDRNSAASARFVVENAREGARKTSARKVGPPGECDESSSGTRVGVEGDRSRAADAREKPMSARCRRDAVVVCGDPDPGLAALPHGDDLRVPRSGTGLRTARCAR